MYAGNLETAAQEANRVLEANPSYETAFVPLAMAAIDAGDFARAAETYQRLGAVSARGSSLATLGLADLARYRGRSKEAAVLLERGVAADLAGGEPTMAAIKLASLASIAQLQERAAAAAAAAKRALETRRSARVLFEVAVVYARAGKAREARELAATIAQGTDPSERAMAELIAGEVALAAGDARAALAHFQSARDGADSWFARYGLGRAQLTAGAFAEAHSELDAALGRRGEVTAAFFDDLPSYNHLPPLHYYLGRALEGLGSDGALGEYRAFLALQGDGDPSALVADARGRIAALGG